MKQGAKVDPAVRQKVDAVIAKEYDNMLNYISIKYFGSKRERFSMTPDDLLQEAVTRFYANLPKTEQDILTIDPLVAYVFASIKRICFRLLSDKYRRQATATRNVENIKGAFYSDDVLSNEDVEARDVIANLHPMFRSLFRDLTTGETVAKTMRNQGITAGTRQFYRAKENLMKDLVKLGCDNE